MATETIPTTITADAAALAKEYGVERELEAILAKGREMVKGLRALVVEAEPPSDMGDPLVIVRAIINPASDEDPSHSAWWIWGLEEFGGEIFAHFLVTTTPQWWGDER